MASGSSRARGRRGRRELGLNPVDPRNRIPNIGAMSITAEDPVRPCSERAGQAGGRDRSVSTRRRPRHTQVMRQARWDPFAAAASVLAFTLLVVYLWVIRQQQDEPPAVWAVAALVVGAAAAGVGAVVAFPYRRASLAGAALLLILLGLLAILTIGLPILLSGALYLVAGWRSRPAASQ